MKMITFDAGKCIGCKNCQYACAQSHHGHCDPALSNIKVNFVSEGGKTHPVPTTCLHCEKAWCMDVCPAGAITRNPKTNAVVIDQTRCAGCKMCILACPFGNIHFDKSAKVSHKCDLCDGDPQCVKHCIAGALNFVEPEEVSKQKSIKVWNQSR